MVAAVLILISTQPLAMGLLKGNDWLMPVLTLGKVWHAMRIQCYVCEGEGHHCLRWDQHAYGPGKGVPERCRRFVCQCNGWQQHASMQSVALHPGMRNTAR